jgi:hypothetical protein
MQGLDSGLGQRTLTINCVSKDSRAVRRWPFVQYEDEDRLPNSGKVEKWSDEGRQPSRAPGVLGWSSRGNAGDHETFAVGDVQGGAVRRHGWRSMPPGKSDMEEASFLAKGDSVEAALRCY